MRNSVLLKVFNRLSPTDLTALRKFVRSPFFNKRADVIQLFDYLFAIHHRQDEYLWQKKTVFKALFPDRSYKDSEIRYTMSFLLKAIQQYLTYTELSKDTIGNKIHLCRALRARGLDNLFEKELKSVERLQEKEGLRNIQFHFNNYLLHRERYQYIHRKQRSGALDLQELSGELTIFYFADILRQSCSMLTHQSMTPRTYDLSMLDRVLEEVKQEEYQKVPAIAIYYWAYWSLRDMDQEENFSKFKALIEQYWQLFPAIEIRDIYLLAINYCIKRLNRGHKKYIREAFEMYRQGLTNEVLLENGFLSTFTYNNIHSLASGLNEMTWLAHFLVSYKDKLLPAERENTYLYNQAIFYFRQPDYEKAMVLLQKVEFKDVLYNLDARRMLLRIYYELDEFDALDSLLDSFKIYIKRQKNIGYHRENYLNLIYFIKKIMNNNLRDKSFRKKLLEEIEVKEAIAERAWLLEQVGRL